MKKHTTPTDPPCLLIALTAEVFMDARAFKAISHTAIARAPYGGKGDGIANSPIVTTTGVQAFSAISHTGIARIPYWGEGDGKTNSQTPHPRTLLSWSLCWSLLVPI